MNNSGCKFPLLCSYGRRRFVRIRNLSRVILYRCFFFTLWSYIFFRCFVEQIYTWSRDFPIPGSICPFKEKKKDIWLGFMTKALIHVPTENSKKNKWQHRNATKTSITQRLRTDLGRSVGITTAGHVEIRNH